MSTQTDTYIKIFNEFFKFADASLRFSKYRVYRSAFFEFMIEKFKNNEVTFKQLVDNFKEIRDYYDDFPCLHYLFNDTTWLFEDLIQNNSLSYEDLKYLLNKIDNPIELRDLCENTPLIKKVLNDFVLDKESVDKFNGIIEKNSQCKERNIHNIFELIRWHQRGIGWFECDEEDYDEDEEKIDKKNLKLLELNKIMYTFDLNEDQKPKLAEVLKDNDIAQNKLNKIIENHLESNYNFDSLIQYLKKAEKKTLLNI